MTILRRMAQLMKDLETLNLIHSTKDITCKAIYDYYKIELLDIELYNKNTIIQALKDEFSTSMLSSFDFDSLHTLSFKIYRSK